MTSAQHAEGRQFDPGRVYLFIINIRLWQHADTAMKRPISPLLLASTTAFFFVSPLRALCTMFPLRLPSTIALLPEGEGRRPEARERERERERERDSDRKRSGGRGRSWVGEFFPGRSEIFPVFFFSRPKACIFAESRKRAQIKTQKPLANAIHFAHSQTPRVDFLSISLLRWRSPPLQGRFANQRFKVGLSAPIANAMRNLWLRNKKRIPETFGGKRPGASRTPKHIKLRQA